MLIKTTKTVRLVTTLSEIDIDTEFFEIFPASWAYQMLEELSKTSQRTPFHWAEIERLNWAIKLLTPSSMWRRIRNAPLNEIGVNELVALFHDAENFIHTKRWSVTTKMSTSAEFRKFVRNFFYHEKNRTDITQRALSFKSKKFNKRSPRPLISDARLEVGVPAYPIGAIPHRNFIDLKSKMSARLLADIKTIESACGVEFENFTKTRRELINFSSEKYNSQTREAIINIGEQQVEERTKNALAKMEPEILLQFYMEHLSSERADAGCPPFGMRSFHGYEKIRNYLNSENTAELNRGVLYYPFIGNGLILAACLIALQIHTAWNASSIISLTIEDIGYKAQNVLLQGFKSRSDDHTPIVLITPQDKMAYQAIQILTSRLEHLKRLRFVSSQSRSLWLTAVHQASSPPPPDQLFRGFQQARKNLCSKHNIEDFSFDQIRTQVLAIHSLSRGGLELARRVGGHSIVSTTGHYLDQVLLQRLYSATNAEFQRRLERSIEYIAFKSGGVSNSEPRDFLLYPIGDGSVCLEPERPPENQWLLAGKCEAQHCHAGDGCPNRRIQIDDNRIDEIVLTTLFYENNWSRLLNENPSRFEKIHFPAMIFNLGLVGVIEAGHYGPLLRLRSAYLRETYA